MGQSHESLRGKKNGSTRDALRATAEDVMEDFAELRRDVGKLADAANHAARSEVHDARDRIERLGRGVRDEATDRVSSLTEKVRSHPAAALGISASVGVLVGLFLSARRH